MAVIGDNVVVQLDDYKGTLRTFGDGDILNIDIDERFDVNDLTGLGEDVHHGVNGLLQAPVSLRGNFSTTALTGTHTVLRDAYLAGVPVTLQVAVATISGSPITPITGDPIYSGEFYVESYHTMVDTGRTVTFMTSLRPAVGVGTQAPQWTTVA